MKKTFTFVADEPGEYSVFDRIDSKGRLLIGDGFFKFDRCELEELVHRFPKKCNKFTLTIETK